MIMKHSIRLMRSSFFLLCLAIAALAQSDERDIIKKYDSGQMAGMQVTIFLKQADGTLVPVDPRREFKKGEMVRISLESNFAGYVYVVNLGSSGKETIIFPDAKESNRIEPRRRYLLPATYDLEFDAQAGLETLRVYFAARPIAFFTAAIKARQGQLSTGDSLAAAGLWKAHQQPVGIVVGDSLVGVKPSGLALVATRDPIWDEGKKTSLVTLRRHKRKSNQLSAKEVTVIGVHLKNAGAVQ
jgi:hypothetical protein